MPSKTVSVSIKSGPAAPSRASVTVDMVPPLFEAPASATAPMPADSAGLIALVGLQCIPHPSIENKFPLVVRAAADGPGVALSLVPVPDEGISLRLAAAGGAAAEEVPGVDGSATSCELWDSAKLVAVATLGQTDTVGSNLRHGRFDSVELLVVALPVKPAGGGSKKAAPKPAPPASRLQALLSVLTLEAARPVSPGPPPLPPAEQQQQQQQQPARVTLSLHPQSDWSLCTSVVLNLVPKQPAP
ncbi:hypothetical protein DIPPA_11547 [Diplonema papillatum]|nr:hypothetical protein DIPPA_11547 [Diplonema papillatum]